MCDEGRGEQDAQGRLFWHIASRCTRLRRFSLPHPVAQSCRERAKLAIASFIIHELGWQASTRFLGQLFEMTNISSGLLPNGVPRA
jgi:hypothetical protein